MEDWKRMMTFEDLEVWTQARVLVREIYSLCCDERLARDFGLRDQIQRAAVSVMSNLAEGFERKGIQEKLHFYNIARASCGEVRSLLYVVEDNFPHVTEPALTLRANSIEVGRLVSGLIISTQKRTTSQ